MSTLKVSTIQNAATTAGGISIDSSGAVSGGLPSPNRNLLYNGAMQVAQRGTSTTGITGSGYYTADRWSFFPLTCGTWTQTIESDAPTGSGLRKSLKVLCTTADAAPSGSDLVTVTQLLEGQDLQRIAKGTASAQQLTLSFWVKSNVIGTFVCELEDTDNTRTISASYSVSASATWEKKTLTFAADTTGVLDNDNAGSLTARFWLAASSTWTSGSLQTTWGSTTNANRAVGQTNLAAATNNYWQVTGVQLEVGPVATSFEFKSFGQELRECQRYYQRFAGGAAYSMYGLGPAYSTTAAFPHVALKQKMRAKPTAVESSLVSVGDGANALLTTSAISLNALYSGPDIAACDVSVTGATQYRTYLLLNNNNDNGYIAFSAEL